MESAGDGVVCLTLSRAGLTIEDCERFLSAERCVVIFDESCRRVCPDSETYVSASKDVPLHSRDIGVLAWRLELLLMTSWAYKTVLLENKGEVAAAVLERARKDLNRRIWQDVLPSMPEYLHEIAGDSPQHAKLCSAIKAQPLRTLAVAILSYLLGHTLWLRSLLDFTVLTEVLGWDTQPLTVQLPPAADDSSKALVAAFKALLDDSKVVDRSNKSQSAVEDIFFKLIDAHGGISALGRLIKCELDPGALSGFSCERRATRLEDCLNHRVLESAISLSEALQCHLREYLKSERASLIQKYAKSEEPLPEVAAGTPEAKAFYELISEKRVNLESAITSFSGEIPCRTATAWEKCHTLVEMCRHCSHLTSSLLSAAEMTLLHANCAKISAKKKNVSWSLKFGRGINEYVTHYDPIHVDEGIAELIPRRASLERYLTGVNQLQKKPKVAKGCVDFTPTEMRFREAILSRVTNVFKLYGAEPIDTPVFELKEVLTGKYGEDQKLIYDLKDQGGELLGLRYDLTVPFARYCATNAVEKIKRYHVGKVYRRDEPQIARGRLREFYQCDVDIAGLYDPMTADAEVLSMLIHILKELRPIIGDFQIKLSHRKLLDGMMEVAGVPKAKLRGISSAIDKLDKESWEAVEAEMCGVKGLSTEVAQRLKVLVNFAGPFEDVAKGLCEIEGVSTNQSAMEALAELRVLYGLLKHVEGLDAILQTNTSLARGLDYYTGVIYEAVLIDDGTSLGSIAAGGRYDKLIGMFSSKDIPAVGVSLGVERIFRMIQKRFNVQKFKVETIGDRPESIPTNRADVFICSTNNESMEYKFKIAGILRAASIRTEFCLNDNLKTNKQMSILLEQNVPLGVFFGPDEIQEQTVKVKSFYGGESGEETKIALDCLAGEIQKALRDHSQTTRTLETLLFAQKDQ